MFGIGFDLINIFDPNSSPYLIEIIATIQIWTRILNLNLNMIENKMNFIENLSNLIKNIKIFIPVISVLSPMGSASNQPYG